MNEEMKIVFKMFGFASAVTCNWLMFTFLLTELITGQHVVLYFNTYNEMWVELVFLIVSFVGIGIFTKEWLVEQWKK